MAEQFIAQMWHVFSMRERSSGLLRNDITQNPYVWAGLLLAALCPPGLTGLARSYSARLGGRAVVLGMSVIPLAIGQVLKDTMGIGV